MGNKVVLVDETVFEAAKLECCRVTRRGEDAGAQHRNWSVFSVDIDRDIDIISADHNRTVLRRVSVSDAEAGAICAGLNDVPVAVAEPVHRRGRFGADIEPTGEMVNVFTSK